MITICIKRQRVYCRSQVLANDRKLQLIVKLNALRGPQLKSLHFQNYSQSKILYII